LYNPPGVKAVAIDSNGRKHVYRDSYPDPGQSFGALMQWWAKVKHRHKIVRVSVSPELVVLPYYGEADLRDFLV